MPELELLHVFRLETEHDMEVVFLCYCEVVVREKVDVEEVFPLIFLMHVARLTIEVWVTVHLVVVELLSIPVASLGKHVVVEFGVDIPTLQRIENEFELMGVAVGLECVVATFCKSESRSWSVV